MEDIKYISEEKNRTIKRELEYIESIGNDISKIGSQKVYKSEDPETLTVVNNYAFDILSTYTYNKTRGIENVKTGLDAIIHSINAKKLGDPIFKAEGVANFVDFEKPEHALKVDEILNSAIENKVKKRLVRN